jgi:predicted TIM-barrel fold metal-dependent hydrolase
MHMSWLAVVVVFAGVAPEPPASTAPDEDAIGTAVYVGAEMLRDYRPAPSLEVPVTAVHAARFPAVDVHCHWNVDEDPQAMLRAMDERNVRAAVNLSGGWGDDLDRMLARFHAAAPDRFIIFCNIDFARIDEPDFAAEQCAFLERARANGARGLKIFKDLGLRIRDRSGALVPVDDPRLDPIWAKCGELGMPVLIHTADPAAFFEPVDETNERWMQLKRHPTWSFAEPELPDRATLFAQRDRVIARHGGTIFICAHVGSHADDLAAAGRLLDACPNAYVDISGRVGALGRQPYSARRFLLEHQDRVLFGTDRFPGRADQPRYRVYYRFLETDDEYFRYYDHPFAPSGDWMIYGVFLPDEVLRKIYHGNAYRIFGTTP